MDQNVEDDGLTFLFYACGFSSFFSTFSALFFTFRTRLELNKFHSENISKGMLSTL
jgi:bacteriorhodopsin